MFSIIKNKAFLIAAPLIAAAAIFFPCAAFAGLGSPTADIEVNNLRIGQSYDLTQMGNLPFKIISTGLERRVKITLIMPAASQCRPGFEPIPDMTWVSISKDDFLLLPGESGLADITVSIPNDETYLGRNFEIKILAATIPKISADEDSGASIGVAIMGSLRFRIAPKPLSEEEKKIFEKAKYKAVNIELTPNDLVLDPIPSGKKLNIEKTYGKSLKLVNTGDTAARVRIRSIPLSETGIQVPPGWENPPEGAYILLKKEKVKIKPLEIKKLAFKIYIPPDDKYKNKKYIFIVEASIEDKQVKTSYRSKVYVPTN